MSVVGLVFSGLSTAANLLREINKLANDMRDAKHACERLHKRLTEIYDALKSMESAGRLPQQCDLTQYLRLLQSYKSLLQWYANRPLIFRLRKHQQLMEDLRDIHEEVDALMRLFQIASTDAMKKWKEEWSLDCDAQLKILTTIVDNSASLLNEVRGVKAQVVALMDSKFTVDAPNNQSKEMVTLVKKFLDQMIRVSKTQVPAIPRWYVPPDDVKYDPQEFAKGSYGSVHHGTWGRSVHVVVKCLFLDDMLNASGNLDVMPQRILNEINIWADLHHPNVLEMFCACHTASPPFIVCEYAANGNVFEFLGKTTKFKRYQMWKLLLDAASGLAYLHSKSIVHGDLKLNNILVDVNGRGRIADFGLSSVRTASSTSTRRNRRSKLDQQFGALRWRAPEVMTGRPKFASDVYSLAMCIIEAATGVPPFAYVDDNTVFQLLGHCSQFKELCARRNFALSQQQHNCNNISA